MIWSPGADACAPSPFMEAIIAAIWSEACCCCCGLDINGNPWNPWPIMNDGGANRRGNVPLFARFK